MSPGRGPWPIGARAGALLAIALAGVLAAAVLGLTPSGLALRPGGFELARDLFRAALAPAWTHEVAPTVPDAAPFFVKLGAAVLRTLTFAVAALSLALPLGALLGLGASEALWRSERHRPRGARSQRVAASLRNVCALGLRWTLRALIAALRSVHELLWALFFLAALGLNTAAAVLALALPFAGTLAKVFSELIDEAPDRATCALELLGAPRTGRVLLGRVAEALPDLAAYTFYRFECAVRSATVLGFFGYPTLGFHLQLAFEDLHFRELWSYLYALFGLVIALELWSGALRRRLVA